ncbi:MAG: ABC transporter ATP-binding protein [Sandaracinaceae bacterium]|nr:ABC transporter ATP-binding protein [Sandaracinaceae bacterium]
MAEPLLRVEDLVTAFHTDEGSIRAVDGVSFELEDGKTLGIVGESGCGKSVTSLSIMRLVPTPPGAIERGAIRFRGKDLLAIPEGEMRKLRGNDISMIFQEPMTSLNPVHRIGKQIGESVRHHRGASAKEARARAIEMLELVGIPAPEKRVDAYPHELSGGMRQRVMIAMALACDPRLLIADEPTTALDVTIQAQILELLGELKARLGMSIVFITHDLGVVAELTDDVVVMYAGKVVERAPTADLFEDPQHPYTRGLLGSIPGYGATTTAEGERPKLATIPGMVPDLRHLPKGCRFQDRCELVHARCRESEPPLVELRGGRRAVACFAAEGGA